MTNYEKLGKRAHAQHQESFFFLRMFIVEKLNAKLVVEGRFRLFKRYVMLFEICRRFSLIPFKIYHTYIVRMLFYKSSPLAALAARIAQGV